MQKEDSPTTGYHSQLQQQRFRQRPNVSETANPPSLPPAFNQATSQHDRISIFLSLLLPEAIREIKEAVSAEPDMVAQRVRAIVTRHLGPEILSKFFSNQLTTSSSSSSSSIHLTRSSSDALDSRCCQHLAEKFQQQPSHPPAPSLLKESPTGPAPVSTAPQQQPHKRPSLVQELSVTSDGGPPPTPLLYSSHANKKDHPPAGSVVYGTRQRLGCCQQSHHQPLSTLTASSAQTSGTTTPTSFDSMASSSPWIAVGRQPPPARKHTISVSSASSSQEIHSTAGVLESLLMGGDVQDVRFKRTSGSNCCGRHRNSSEVMVDSRSTEFRQTLSNSGPSSACCQAPKLNSFTLFGLENEEWPGVTPSSPNGPRAANPSSTSQVFMSPNSSSSSCSSLAHLLRHGCPLAPAASFNGSNATSVASTASSETLTSLAPSVPTACSVRANRLAVAVPSTSSLTPTSTTDEKSTSRPLDRPLSVIVDPQMNLAKPAHQLQHYDVGQQSSVSSKSLNSLQSNLPPPPHPKEALLAQENSQVQFQSTTARETSRKPNVRDTSEDEDAALANSSLCRLLQGPDPRWETVTAEVESAAQEDAPPPPPPPPPSFFEIPPAMLASGEGEPKRVRYDSCPLTKKEPMSVPSPSPQVDVPRALTGCIGGRADSAKSHRASSSSAPPSAIHTVEAPISSPAWPLIEKRPSRRLISHSVSTALTISCSFVVEDFRFGVSCEREGAGSSSNYERNRQAAAVAAARIAEEAANQRKQLPSSRHLFERQRLLYQQNVGQVTAYHSTSHHHLNNMHQRSYAYGNRGSDQSPGTALVQCAKNAFHDYAPSTTTSVPSQRPPLEDFSRRMKEVAPNVRVSPTVYHPPNSALYGDHQVAHIAPAHDYSGGHLAPVSYEYQEPVPTPPSPHADHQRPPALTPPHYENPQLPSPYHQPQKPPLCASRLPSVQPKTANHPQSQSHQRKPRLSRLSSPQSPHVSDTCGYPPEGSYVSQSFEQKHLHSSSPVSQSLQQQQQPPYSSKVKAGLREKVTSRCQARNTNTMTVGLLTGSTLASQSSPPMAAGQKRPIPSTSHIYHPHHQPSEQQMCYAGPLPLEPYRCYGQPPATPASIPEPQQQFAQYPIRSAGLAKSPLFDPEFASSGGGSSEDIQLTADIVNDVLECESFLFVSSLFPHLGI
ncbi:unnamed protein product [Mesocestoides corti]|uniref:Uncharacterized protein n=1 Tax=Mesocestoides corti TaxID=53468 RepID=A0A3P6HR43_MESCO|nr:unnamed protein product [Mesocestoides corti]